MGVLKVKQNSSEGAKVTDKVARHGAMICERKIRVVDRRFMMSLLCTLGLLVVRTLEVSLLVVVLGCFFGFAFSPLACLGQ